MKDFELQINSILN